MSLIYDAAPTLDRDAHLSMDGLVDALRAAGEETRLRIMALLFDGELTVTDLTRILGQSQPRVSRHIKVLLEAGLVEKHREGSWTFIRATRPPGPINFVAVALELVSANAPERLHDLEQLAQIKLDRHQLAQAYFRSQAGNWDAVRRLYVDEARVERAILDLVEGHTFDRLIDLGTGTGRMLELFAAQTLQGIGFDTSPDMLAYARSQIERTGHRHLQIRHGDLFQLPQFKNSADLVVVHQVLHFLIHPGAAVDAAGRLLGPGGQLLIVDFSPHELEHLRETQHHLRLGISEPQMQRWIRDAGLEFIAHTSLPPDDDVQGQQLTVSMWMCGRPVGSNVKPPQVSQ